jgi:hypothetical protein
VARSSIDCTSRARFSRCAVARRAQGRGGRAAAGRGRVAGALEAGQAARPSLARTHHQPPVVSADLLGADRLCERAAVCVGCGRVRAAAARTRGGPPELPEHVVERRGGGRALLEPALPDERRLRVRQAVEHGSGREVDDLDGLEVLGREEHVPLRVRLRSRTRKGGKARGTGDGAARGSGRQRGVSGTERGACRASGARARLRGLTAASPWVPAGAARRGAHPAARARRALALGGHVLFKGWEQRVLEEHLAGQLVHVHVPLFLRRRRRACAIAAGRVVVEIVQVAEEVVQRAAGAALAVEPEPRAPRGVAGP